MAATLSSSDLIFSSVTSGMKLPIQELGNHTDDDLKSITTNGIYFGKNTTIDGMELVIHKNFNTNEVAQYSFVFGWDGVYYIRARLKNVANAWYNWRVTTASAT